MQGTRNRKGKGKKSANFLKYRAMIMAAAGMEGKKENVEKQGREVGNIVHEDPDFVQ